jgi:hypothetical protein
MHAPEYAQEAQEARRLGGLRRKREVTVAGAYDFEGLETVPHLRRLLEIAAMDALALDNGLGRVRALIAVVGSGTKLIEVGELEERLTVLEQAVLKRDRAEVYEGAGAWGDGLGGEEG